MGFFLFRNERMECSHRYETNENQSTVNKVAISVVHDRQRLNDSQVADIMERVKGMVGG